MSFVSHLSVLQNVYPEQSNPPTSQCVFTSPNIRVHRWNRTDLRSNHWSGIQVARATAARMSLKVGTADSMRGNNGEHVTKLSAANDKRKMKKYKLVNLTMWICSSAHFTSKPPQEKYISCKNPTIKPVGYRLENSRFHFQRCLCKWSGSRDWIWPQLRNHDSKWQRRSWRGFREESSSV